MSEPKDKTFATLSAAFALAGLQLYRTDARDGPVRLFCCSGALLHQLPSMDHAARFLATMAPQSGSVLHPLSPVGAATGEKQ